MGAPLIYRGNARAPESPFFLTMYAKTLQPLRGCGKLLQKLLENILDMTLSNTLMLCIARTFLCKTVFALTNSTNKSNHVWIQSIKRRSIYQVRKMK